MSVLALIPARSGSKGIPNKNFRQLGNSSPVQMAIDVARAAGAEPYLSTDALLGVAYDVNWLDRPDALAQDDTPMIDVVRHALAQIPGPADQIIVLLQPTQPFRKPEHIRQAIQLLEESGADSVVSVVELPLTHHPWSQFMVNSDGTLELYEAMDWADLPASRQELQPTYIRDGTVYAFRRRTVEHYGTIYGQDVRPLLMALEDTCELDTEADWAEVERRWRALSRGTGTRA
jgi:CMP-N,N'-diacetyllegionaminic acid synthase